MGLSWIMFVCTINKPLRFQSCQLANLRIFWSEKIQAHTLYNRPNLWLEKKPRGETSTHWVNVETTEVKINIQHANDRSLWKYYILENVLWNPLYFFWGKCNLLNEVIEPMLSLENLCKKNYLRKLWARKLVMFL